MGISKELKNANLRAKTEQVTEKDDGFAIDLEVFIVDFFKGLKRFGWLCVVFALIAAPMSYLKCRRNYAPVYESSVTFAITTLNDFYNANGSNSYSYIYNQATVSQMESVFPTIIQSALMMDILKNDLGVSFVNASISASVVVSGANLFQITALSSSPKDAYNTVRSIMDNYPQVAEYVIGDTSLAVVSEPEMPTTPKYGFTWAKQTAIGAFGGIALGMAIIAAYAFLKKTVKRRSDIKEKLNYDCIAEVPEVRIKRSSKNSNAKMVVVDKNNPLFSEAFRTMRKRVFSNLDRRGKKIIAVTSAAVGEGKSTVSFNLAYSIATAGKKVALVDLDLRRKSMQQYIRGSEAPLGLTNVVCGEITLDQVVFPYENVENLHIYFAGSKKMKFVEKEFADIFAKLREEYDYIIIDTPPCGIVSDAAAIADIADGILFVIRQDSVSISKVKSAIEYVCFSRAQIIGFVFNGVVEGFTGYGASYYGGYGYYGRKNYGYYGRKHGYGNKAGTYGYGSYGYGGYGDDSSGDETVWTSEYEE